MTDQPDTPTRRPPVDYPMGLSVEALISAASLVRQEWGDHGYHIDKIAPVTWSGSLVMEVCASDGGRFYVGSTKYGNTYSGTDEAAVTEHIQALSADERKKLKEGESSNGNGR